MRDDDLLRRFLLGELSDEDEALFEARLIQDDELFERAEAMEADLLEEHAHGGLSAAQRARLRRHLSSSPATRSQLAVVSGIGKISTEEQPGRILTGPWGGKSLPRSWRHGLAAAAMLAIAIPSAWLAFQTASLPEERDRVAEETPAPVVATAETPAPPMEVSPTPTPERIAHVVPSPEPEPAPTAAPAPVVYAFQLGLTVFRGPEDGPKELRIPAGTERVDIHLPLSPGDESYSTFEVVLRDESNAEVLRRTDLQPVKTGKSPAALVLPVEAKLLRAGRYSMEIYGDGGDLAFPEFQVVEP
jgi:hypothetical protein